MNDNYLLMHKDIQCGVVAIDRISGALSEFSVIDPEHAPFLGNANENNMKTWWKHRAVPGPRTDMAESIRKAGCDSNLDYLAKNLAEYKEGLKQKIVNANKELSEIKYKFKCN